MNPVALFGLTSLTTLSMAQPSLLYSSSMTQGNGVRAELTRTADSFDKIRVDGALRLEIARGSACTITVSGDSNVLPLVETRVERDTLYISETGSFTVETPLAVTVSLPTLEAASLGGAISAHIHSFDGAAFQLEESGSVTVVADSLQLASLSAGVSGTSSLELAGHSTHLRLDVTGESRVDGGAFTASTASLQVAGMSEVTLGACQTLTGTIEGGSTVSYAGTRQSAADLQASFPAAIDYLMP
jgi:hypothetical protein